MKKKLKDPLGNRGKISFYLDYDDGKEQVLHFSSKKIIIPTRSVWVIGDNRSDSWFGSLPIKNIEGVVAL